MKARHLVVARSYTTPPSALLVRLDNKRQEELWIPRSQVHANSELYDETTETGTVVVTNWWAKKNGRPEYDGD